MKTLIIKSLLIILFVNQIYARKVQGYNEKIPENVDSICNKIYNKADIPGLSLILVTGNEIAIKNWGYTDLKSEAKVTSKTLFELGSTSKAFTALAILNLEKQDLINLNDNISKYLPWFNAYYEKSKTDITINQLLRHTSGIPWKAMTHIPQGDKDNLLDSTIRIINNIELNNIPGSKYEYSNINYDILGLIIEKLTKLSFEKYVEDSLFMQLGLKYTSVGKPINDSLSDGFKISFFNPRKYNAPRFKGNNPAGYVISNAEDIAKWLRLQLALDSCIFENLIEKSHQPDFTVNPRGLISYGYGWEVEPYGDKKVFHSGLNPNFSSYIGLIPNKSIGIAILANSNSSYTAYLGDILLSQLNNEDIKEISEPDYSIDKVFSLITFIVAVFIIGIISLLIWMLNGVFRKQRKFATFSFRYLLRILGSAILTLPFIYGIYLLPEALMGLTWETTLVWAPNSYYWACLLFLMAVFGIWGLNVISIMIPTKNQYYRSLPMISILSIMSGLANMIIILLLINAIGNETKTIYILYYFGLALIFYIASRKIVQTKLIKISQLIVYDLRMTLIRKVFLSTFQKFEKIDNGRVYATLNQDTATISNSVNILIGLISNLITIVGVFIYLGSISLVATGFILGIILLVAAIYFFVSSKTNILFEQARDTANKFSGLIDGLLYGFKELSLSGLKKKEYTDEVEVSCSELKNKTGLALIKFVNAFLVGEALLIMVLGTIGFIIPFLFPKIPNYKLLTFIMIVLYLIGPINGVLNSIPNIVQIKISWNRIKGFINEIKPDLNIKEIFTLRKEKVNVDKLLVKDLVFEYQNNSEDRNFKIGPINLNIEKGEIVFIIGGNGSGKTTLANLLTGLYTFDQGSIEINGVKTKSNDLGNYYSTIFSNNHIFKKLYGIDVSSKKKEIEYLLKTFRLDEKVGIDNDSFTTIELSNGQRKRLSLMKTFLEDSQIYLFDEWAADQDPEYKRIFYNEILPEMKANGKIVIAITHDDNYFNVADRIIKMDGGKIVDEYSHEISDKVQIELN